MRDQSIPYVALDPAQGDRPDVAFLFARMGGQSFINSPTDPPHRHAFHELFMVESGAVHHVVDGEPIVIGPRTLSLVARGRVHVFDRSIDATGWRIRVADDFLPTGDERGYWPDLVQPLLWFDTISTISLRLDDVIALNLLGDLIEAEWDRTASSDRDASLRHLVALVFIRLVRIQSAVGHDTTERDDYPAIIRDFTTLLERDFAEHHDVGYYAGVLAVDPVRLSTVLNRLLGKSTKRLIDERLVVEAKRYLHYSDRTLKQIAADLGYRDQFHLSKTFKRLTGLSPLAYRRLKK